MADQLNLVFFPVSYSELFNTWNRYPGAVPYAGGTALIRVQNRQIMDLPPIILSLDRIEEMHRISRSERYLEIGAMVKLNQISNLGKVVPRALRHCLLHIAGPQLRNMATIGGNVCGYLDSSAALSALDAQFELRSAQSVHWISAARFFTNTGASIMKPGELLTRIRIPLETWDYSIYKKFRGQAKQSKVIVFLAKTQKNILSDIRVIYKTGMIWRDKNSESILIGKQLPLNHRIADDFVAGWGNYLAGIQNVDELSRQELINFIGLNVYNLSE